MIDFKEFQGKSLDVAIEEACRYFELDRGKLEIEILSGGSSGIFGLVGVKKACIQARPRPDFRKSLETRGAPAAPAGQAPDTVRAPEATSAPAVSEAQPLPEARPAPAPAARTEAAPREAGPVAPAQPVAVPEVVTRPEPVAPVREERTVPQAVPPSGTRAGAGHPAGRDQDLSVEADLDDEDLASAETLNVDPQLAEDTVRQVLLKLLTPIVPEPRLVFTREGGRIDVFIDDEENSGLIIGREGQTLASIQYLVNRIVCRMLQATVRIQIDTGDYRERQNDSLRRLAGQLAERAKRFGRPQSTKPLSSYHRRVVHMALQSDGQVQTRSKGEGPMKKVLILPRRRGPQRGEPRPDHRPDHREEPRTERPEESRVEHLD